MMDINQLKKLREDHITEREKLIGGINQVNGRIGLLDHLIATEEAEPAKAEDTIMEAAQ